MTYNPLIPIGSNNISVDRSAIQVNFQQANSLINNDHYAFDDATSANRGYHRQIYMPIATVGSPSLGGFAGVFFCQDDANDTATRPQLFWKNSSNTYQVTNRFRDGSATGYWMLNDASSTQPGLIIMWGTRSITTGSGQPTVTLPPITNYAYSGLQTQGFPNNIFNVSLTSNYGSVSDGPTQFCVDTSSFSKTSFRVRYTGASANGNLYWYAIGN